MRHMRKTLPHAPPGACTASVSAALRVAPAGLGSSGGLNGVGAPLPCTPDVSSALLDLLPVEAAVGTGAGSSSSSSAARGSGSGGGGGGAQGSVPLEHAPLVCVGGGGGGGSRASLLAPLMEDEE
eukprot:283804-Chlamydomonas_euryale.AAC.1